MKSHFRIKKFFSSLSYWNRLLLSVLIFIALIIILTTVFYFAKGGFGSPSVFGGKNSLERSDLSTGKENFSPSHFYEDGYSLFAGLSRLRATTSDGVSVVVFPWLSYSKDDTQFYEELSQKTQELKEITTGYFSERTKAELLAAGEDTIKQSICNFMNQSLTLNKIKTVYFSEYIFLD